jgi:hypothetical protein
VREALSRKVPFLSISSEKVDMLTFDGDDPHSKVGLKLRMAV